MRMGLLLVLYAALSPSAWAADCRAIAGLVSAANQELDHGSAPAAAQLLQPVAASPADCPALLLTQARIAGSADAPAATALFEQYLVAQPGDANGYAYFARYLLDHEQYQRADELSSTALAKDGNAAAALAVRGQLLAMKGEREQAIALLTRACEREPEDVRAQFDLGTLEDHAKRPAAAALHLEKVIAITPQNPQAWDYLALNRERLGRVDGALEAYAKGLAYNQPGPFFDAFLDYNYGRLLLKLNRLADSRIHLDRAVELVPQMRATWYERAKLDLLLKDYPQARRDAEQAAAIPDAHGYIIDLQVYTLLEQVYRRLGETELAAKYAELERQTPPPVRGEHPE